MRPRSRLAWGLIVWGSSPVSHTGLAGHTHQRQVAAQRLRSLLLLSGIPLREGEGEGEGEGEAEAEAEGEGEGEGEGSRVGVT